MLTEEAKALHRLVRFSVLETAGWRGTFFTETHRSTKGC